MTSSTLVFAVQHAADERRIRAVMRRLPAMSGAPLRIERRAGLRDRRGAVHAGAFLRERRIVFDCTAAEFPRVFVHELFHFAWRRAGNGLRLEYEALLRRERDQGARGELGWSAEWRKTGLRDEDVRLRNRRWREYCCESYCDTAAWLYGGVEEHEEFTLRARFRAARRLWFQKMVEARRLSI